MYSFCVEETRRNEYVALPILAWVETRLSWQNQNQSSKIMVSNEPLEIIKALMNIQSGKMENGIPL